MGVYSIVITTLCFADAHSEPGDSPLRFEKLGSFIADRQPDRIVQLGDFISLSSISGWDMSKKLLMEGRRYREDIEAGRQAVESIFSPLESLQNRQRKSKVKLYSPEIDWLEGNHEERLGRWLEQHPEMEGSFDLARDLGLTQRGIVPHPYRQRIKRYGVNYMHAPLAGNDQPISGLHIPYKALQRFNSHIVMGHYHRSESATIKRTDAPHVQRAIVCPAFFDGQPHYLSPSCPATIDRGVILIHQREDEMTPRITEIGLEQLYSEY